MDLKKLLDETKDAEVEDGRPILSFQHVGDSIGAKFVGLRTGIKTKKSASATAIDLNVLEGNIENDEGVLIRGECTTWASTHLDQIFSQAGLKPGKVFILRLASINAKSGFKKFFFKVVEEPEKSAVDKGDNIAF